LAVDVAADCAAADFAAASEALAVDVAADCAAAGFAAAELAAGALTVALVAEAVRLSESPTKIVDEACKPSLADNNSDKVIPLALAIAHKVSPDFTVYDDPFAA